MINIEKLHTFYHVVKEGSYGRAAAATGKSRTVLSNHISWLEKECGQNLISVVKKNIVLSEKGIELFRMAQEVVPMIEGPVNEFFYSSQKYEKEKKLKIITTTGTIGFWLLEKLKQFQETFPEVEVSIITINENISFLDSVGDVGLLQRLNEEGIHQRKVLTVKTRLFASQEYVRKHGTPKNLEDLKNHRLISFYSGQEGNLGNVDWHTNRGMPLNQIRKSSLRANSAPLIVDAAVKGLGIIAMSDHFEYIKTHNLVPILPDEPPQEFEVFYITRKGKLHSEEEETLYRLLLQKESGSNN